MTVVAALLIGCSATADRDGTGAVDTAEVSTVESDAGDGGRVDAEDVARVDVCAWADVELSSIELVSQRYERGLNGGADIYPVFASEDGPRVLRSVADGAVEVSCELLTYGSGQDTRMRVGAITVELTFDPESEFRLPDEDEVEEDDGAFFDHRGIRGYADFPDSLRIPLSESVLLRITIPSSGTSAGHHESIVLSNYLATTDLLAQRMVDAWVDGRVPSFTAERVESTRNAARICETLALDLEEWSLPGDPELSLSTFTETTDNPGDMYYYDTCSLRSAAGGEDTSVGITADLSWLGGDDRLGEWEKLWVRTTDGCTAPEGVATIVCTDTNITVRVISGGWYIEFNRYDGTEGTGESVASAELQTKVAKQAAQAASRVGSLQLGALDEFGWAAPVPDPRMVPTSTSHEVPGSLTCRTGTPQIVVETASMIVGDCALDGTLVGTYEGVDFASERFIGPAGISCAILESGERLCFSRIDVTVTTQTDGLVTSEVREYLDSYWYDATQVG